MHKVKKQYFLYLFSFLLLLLITALILFLTKVNFAGDIDIELKTHSECYKNINLYATTPAEKQQAFYFSDDNVYNVSGYYKNIFISIDTNVIHKFKSVDSLSVSINETNHVFSFNYILNNWAPNASNNRCIFSVPITLQTNSSIISKLNAFLVYSDSPLIKIFIYVIVCFFIIITLLLYYSFKTFFTNIIKSVRPKAVIVFLSFLTLVYFGVFLKICSFSNTVALSSDSWEYQVMAVNFAKGHGLQRLSMLEPLETYKFNTSFADAESTNNLNTSPYYTVDTYRTPGYAMFLGLIYKIAGISPFAAKAIQLFLLCFVASFASYLLYVIWRWKGFLSGIAGGFLFLTSYYTSAGNIMTEVLLIFISFLLIWSIIRFNKKPSCLLSIAIGVLMGISLLVKGMIIFVPVLFLGFLLIKYFKSKDRFLKKNILLVFLFFILTLLPWSVYASSVNKFLSIEPVSKKEIVTSTLTVDYIFKNKKINDDNILEVIDTVSNVYYYYHYWDTHRYWFVRGFTKKHPDVILKNYKYVIDNARKEMNQIYFDHLYYLSVPFFNNKYLYINFSGLTLLSNQPKTLLLETNNEYCTDGGWHKEKKITDYYSTDNPYDGSLVRVLKFYFTYPRTIYEIFPAKLYAGFKDFIFSQLLVLLLIMSSVKPRMNKWWHGLIILLLIPLFFFLMNHFKFLLPFLIIIAVLMLVIKYIQHKNPYPMSVPGIFNIFFFNIFLITLIFYGLNRFTFITEFIVIPVTLLYLAYVLRGVFGGDKES